MKKLNLKLKNNKRGITLIALVITILILLILAGVSIATLIGDNGILTRVSEASERTKEANAKEKVQLAVIACIREDGHIDIDDLNTELSKVEGLTSESSIGSLPADIVVDGYIITIESNGNVIKRENISAKEIKGKFYEKDTDILLEGNLITIPGGATISGISTETDINNGLVIYITNGEVITNWNDTETIKQAYDQFVWVPVEKAFVTETEIGGNSYDNLKNYVLTNDIYPMAIQLSDGNYKGILYNFEEGADGVTITPRDYTTVSSYREPDIVNFDGNTTYLNQINGILNTSYSTSDSFKNELQKEYKTMVERVNSKGGFWVGRYEASNMSNTTTTSYSNTNEIQIEVRKGANTGITNVTWYRMYAQQKKYSNLALTNSTSITSSMVWGSQWEQVMIWMKDVKNEVNPTNGHFYVINAVGMGNFGVVDADDYDDTSNPVATGYYDVKNIYDLAGNAYDWTLEADNNNLRVRRRRRLR